MSAPHRIEELIVDLSFERETDGDTPVDEDLLRGLVLDRLLPALDQALSLHAEDGVVTQIDSLEIDLGEIPEQELASELPLRVQERMRRALADLLGSAVQSTAAPGVRTISRAAADADLLQRYLTHGRSSPRAEAGGLAPHETALDRLLEGATGELLTFLRQAQMRPIFARRLAQQFPERQLHALLRALMPVSAADELSKLIARFEQLISGSEADGASRRHMLRLLWQYVLDLALRGSAGTSGPVLSEASTRMPIPSGLRSAAARLRGELKPDAQHPVDGHAAQLLNQLVSGMTPVPATSDQSAVATRAHDNLVAADNEAVVRALTQALLHANIADFAPTTKWWHLLQERSPLWREAMHRIDTSSGAWRRIATAVPLSMLDEMTALLALEAASALRPLMTDSVPSETGRGATEWDVQQLWVTSVMHLLHVNTASFDADRYTDVLLDQMAGNDHALRNARASAWLAALSREGTANGPAGGIARALSAQLALPGPQASPEATDFPIDTEVAPVAISADEPQRRPDSRSVTASSIVQGYSELIEMLDLPAQQQTARLQQWLSQVRESGRGVAAHRWTVDQLHHLINAVAALDGTGRQATMLQAIALHAPRARNQQRYFALILEQLVRGALLDLDAIVADCNAIGKDHRTHSSEQAITNQAGQAPGASAMQVVRSASLEARIIEALAAGDNALEELLEELHRERALSRHVGQTAGFSGMASILYQLTAASVDAAGNSMLLDAIATHARRSSDAAQYLRHVLDDLTHERVVDLELIDGRIVRDRLPSSAAQKGEPESAADGIVERIVKALSSANPAGLYPDWTVWKNAQAPALQRALHQTGASTDVWHQVVATFPASLLDDMTALLAPGAASALRPMMTSEAMFASAGGAARHGSVKQWMQQLWIASFMYLLELKQTRFNAGDYAAALLTAMTGSDQAAYRKLAREWKKVLPAEPASGMHADAEASLQSVAAEQAPVQGFPSTNRAGNSRYPDATIEQTHSELAKVLDLPPHQQATWLRQWLSQVQTGGLEVNAGRLNAEQLQRLINAVAALDSNGRQASMLQAIALHAPRARNQQRYFALVLEQLVRGALLDLDAIVADCNAIGKDHHEPSTDEKAGGRAGRSEAAAPAPLGMNGAEIERTQADDAASVRERAVKALLNADPVSLYPDWEGLLRTHAQALLQALHQVGARIDVWHKVAASFPASLLEDMIALLAPEAASALRPLLERSVSPEPVHGPVEPAGQPQSVHQLWVVSIMHLLNAKAGFDAGRYADALLDQLAGQDRARRRKSAAAWRDVISAQEKTDSSLHAVAQALSEQLALPQSASAATGMNRSIDAGAITENGLYEVRTAIANALAQGDHAALKSMLHRLPSAGPADELPDMADDAVVAHRLIHSLVTAAAGGAHRGTLLQAITSHAARNTDPGRFFLHVLEDLVHARTIDLDAIEERCAASDDATPRSTATHTSKKPPIGTAVNPTHRSMPLRLGSWLAQLLAAHPPAARAALAPILHEAGTVTSADQLPRALLRRIVLLLAGADESAMQRHASDVSDIFAQCHPAVGRDRIEELKWHFLFAWLFEQRRQFESSRFSHALVDHLTGRTGVAPTAGIKELLRRRLGVEPPAQDESPALIKAATTYLMPEAPADEVEEIYIGNAGQVLAAPYMPRLFSMLNLTEGGRFKSDEAAERAVHLLQFMVSGQSDCPEYQLGLNKLLCGVKAGQPIVREIEIESHEKEVVEALIKAMIEHWKIIGNTSVDGLRVSFLQRPGSLHLKDDAWYLTVQATSIDMLLDRLPWSFSIIKHPWMERAVHVNWR